MELDGGCNWGLRWRLSRFQQWNWQSGIVYNWHWATKTPVIGYGKQRLGQDTETPLNSAEAEVSLLLSEIYCQYQTRKAGSCDHSRPIRGQYPGHVITLSQSEASIQVMWSVSTNQRPVSRSCDHSRPIRGQYPGHVITLDQSEASIQVMWYLSTNQRPVSRSCDHSRPIRGQYPGHVITLHQSEASIHVMWSLSTNQTRKARSDHRRSFKKFHQIRRFQLRLWS